MQGGIATLVVVLLAVLQVIRERGPADRFLGIAEGIRDYFRVGPQPPP